MNEGFFDDWEGPIWGLRLPFNTWNALQTGDITTIDQLRVIADQIQWLPIIGSKMALTIRVELGRVALLEVLFPIPDQHRRKA